MKHKRDSWQTWENYAQVAVRVQQWQTAVRAEGDPSSGNRVLWGAGRGAFSNVVKLSQT